MDKATRLRLFFDRLSMAPAAATQSEAYDLVCRTLEMVEDAHSGAPNDPQSWSTDGRLYPPQSDREHAVDGYPEVRRYRSFKHNTYVRNNGAIEIRLSGSDKVLFTKNGANGKGV